MVSPSKKRKDRRGRENCECKEPGQLKTKLTGSKKSAKSFKPLVSKKFYLDIKNNATLQKLESKLKCFGAVIEQFLVKEVDYVVTDRKDPLSPETGASCSTPIQSPLPSPSIGVSSPLDGLGGKKSKTRADAMLERVRLQPQTITLNPLENARSWNIPIYSLKEIFARLEKLSAKGKSGSKNSSSRKQLNGHYVKLESGRRPEFKQFRKWPSINLCSRKGESPFVPCKDGSQRMHRKLSRDETDRFDGGYCEMCCVDFPDIKIHVLTPEHIKYSTTADNYAKLDTVIGSKTVDAFIASQMCAGLTGGQQRCLRSGSVEGRANSMGSRNSSLTQINGFLPRTRATARSLDDSCAKNPLEVQCNGIVNHNHLTRSAVKSDSSLTKLEYEGVSRRTRTISASCPGTNNELSQLSPTGSDTTHHLRSRKQMWLPTSLLGTTAEDSICSTRIRPSRDYQTSESLKSPGGGKGLVKSPVVSVADESLEKKIKCSGRDEEVSKLGKLSGDCSDVDGYKHNEISDDEEDVNERRSSKNHEQSKSKDMEDSKLAGFKHKLKRKASNICRELVNLSYGDKRRKVQRKRLSVEEKLIEDNKTYYKVEVLNSKLRSTGYYLSQSQRELEMSRTNGNDGCVIQNSTEPSKNDVKAGEKEPVVVRFKKVRQTELSLLSDEAESFMFGEPSKRESSVSTESSSEDDEISLKLDSEKPDRIITKIKKEVLDESSLGSSSIASNSTYSRRKRKSPDESILQDNAEYYKFEATGSRLRFHGNFFQTSKGIDDVKKELLFESPTDVKINPLQTKLDESDFQPENIINEDKLLNEKDKLDNLEFSFERPPVHEPWYQTFQRQDECNESYYRSYTDYPKVLLPYEYPNSLLKKLKVIKVTGKRRGKKRKERIQQIIVDDKPRKSPRCHASTLAIMSSLRRRRPRDSPEKKADIPSSELSMNEILLQDEESRCSTFIDPPSIAPTDSQMSVPHSSVPTLPQIKIDNKCDTVADTKEEDDRNKAAEANIDELFTNVCLKNEDDMLSQILLSVKQEIDASSVKDSCRKGKLKSKPVGVKREQTVDLSSIVTCLPIDSQVLEKELVDNCCPPGPTVDVLNLLDCYRGCSSMERADYEHMNPHAVDALRALIADSCNSSDCGGSSACDFSFLDDGRSGKRRKRKKRNMTGWPANHKRKLLKKSEELSTAVLRKSCSAKDALGAELVKESTMVTSAQLDASSDSVKAKDNSSKAELNEHADEDVDMKVDPVKLDTKVSSTISRTQSIDSSSVKSLDVQSCYIRVKKMPDECVESLSRSLRSSDSNQTSSSPHRRNSSRQAKISGRKSLRRCR